MDLLALADFNLVARHGGFGRAARATGRPKATLSRRVVELEKSLGVRLLERGARVLKLTEEGQAFYERTAALLTEIDETAAALVSGNASARGTLRISAPLLFAQTAMGTLAAGFMLACPEVRLEVTADDRPVDMVEEGYDLVIRVNPDVDESLVGRIFLRDKLVVVAAPGIARPAGDTPVPAVVRGTGSRAAPWVLKSAGGSGGASVTGGTGATSGTSVTSVTSVTSGTGGTSVIAIEPVLRLSSFVMVRDAVRAGVGAACLPVSLVSHDLASGRLLAWGDADTPEIAIWALYPSRRLLNARVSAFLDYLKRAFPKGTPDELAAFIAH